MTIPKTIVKVCSTKHDEDDAVGIKTNLTIDLSNLNEDDLVEIVASAAVIKWQAKARKMQEIPKTATYTVPKPGTRVAETLDDKIARLTPEERKALAQKLLAGK